MNDETPRAAAAASLTIVRHVTVPRERVFAAFTDPDLLRRWWGPEGCSTPDPQVDLTVGGTYRLDMHGSDGSVYKLNGRYLEVDPPARLAFTWTWQEGAYAGQETVVAVDFRASGTGTEITLTHSGFTGPEMRDDHRRGWESSFGCLLADDGW